MNNQIRVYLGDAVYAEFDGYHVILKTNNPDNPDNKIFLDYSTARNLIDYIEETHLKKLRKPPV